MSEKRLGSREFQKNFKRVRDSLKPGESLAVTDRGKDCLIVTKPPARAAKTPPFRKLVESHPYPARQGEALLGLLDRTDDRLS